MDDDSDNDILVDVDDDSDGDSDGDDDGDDDGDVDVDNDSDVDVDDDDDDDDDDDHDHHVNDGADRLIVLTILEKTGGVDDNFFEAADDNANIDGVDDTDLLIRWTKVTTDSDASIGPVPTSEFMPMTVVLSVDGDGNKLFGEVVEFKVTSHFMSCFCELGV